MSTQSADHGRLFRQEVLDARSARWLGSIRFAQPIGDRLAMGAAVAVIAAIVAFAVFGTYTRRATVSGLLEPQGGVVRLNAPAAGTVTTVVAVEGARVAAGDVLFVVSGERLSTTGSTQRMIGTQLEARRATLERDLQLGVARNASRIRSTLERLASIDVESDRLAQEREINAARGRIAQANVDRFEILARTGFVSDLQAQTRIDDALVIDGQRASLERVAAGLARERNALTAQIDDSRLQAASERATVERSLALLDQERSENEARRSTVVIAPGDGTVTAIAARVGQLVGPGALLATLLPEGRPLEAQLYASTRQVGFVERGQRVRLRYAAYPYQKFGMGDGTVEAVEQSPYAPQELPTQVAATLGPATLQGGEPVYRIDVRIDAQDIDAYGRRQALRPGMVFEADILQDHRRLIEWLLEPVYGLVGR